MRKLFCFLAAGFLTATTVFMGCKKKSTAASTNVDSLLITTTMTTANGGNTGTAIVGASINTTTAGYTRIELNVSGSVNLSKIYILKSEDNGIFNPVVLSSIKTFFTPTDSAIFAGGSSSYSLSVPANRQSFIVDVPIGIRSAGGISDVYYVWITSGTGNFLEPTKNTVLGPAIITLNYTAVPITTYSYATLYLGTQSALANNFLVTSGRVSALSTDGYNDAPASVDIRLVTLNTSYKKDDLATDVYLYSPNDVTDANPAVMPRADFTIAAGSKTTYFAPYTGATSYDNATSADLQFTSLTSGKYILVTAGGVYEFQTATGKKGLIRINSLTQETDADKGYDGSVSLKVLN